MRLRARLVTPLVVPLGAALAFALGADDPLDLVGSGPKAVLAFRITDGEDHPLPARLTFVTASDPRPELFTRTDAAPRELAVRRNLVYTRTGEGRITVPPGRYLVLASHGLEWSLARAELVLSEGAEARFAARLVHEVDTAGWVGADFHLHTLTYSGHGDANLDERILALLGEGVEFAVATDHDHHTDYAPTIAELEAGARLSAVTGNEVSTQIGHFNAFPLDPSRPPVDPALRDANELFRRLRAETSPAGVVPVIQVNHPRLRGLDYFGLTGLDPVTGASADPAHAADYDALEILNENVGWGYFDPSEGVEVGATSHSVLHDWFQLLDRGLRCAAVGNSDSHHVESILAGFPRNFVQVGRDEPGAIDPAAVARAVRAKALFTTTGPFVTFSVDGVPMGGEARAPGGEAKLSLRVQAASWIDCDAVQIVRNGEIVQTIPIPPSNAPLRLEREVELCLRRQCARHGGALLGGAEEPEDAWVCLLVQGDRSLAPIVPDRARPALPLCVTNPVWIDADGDGRFTSPLERARARVEAADPAAFAEAFSRRASDRALLLQALAESTAFDEGFVLSAVLDGLGDADRRVRLSALRTAERRPQEVLLMPLRAALARTADPYEALASLRALAACGEPDPSTLWDGLFRRFDLAALRRDAPELVAHLPGRAVLEWLAVGPFPGAAPAETLARDPRRAEDAGPFPAGPAGGGASLAWREVDAREPDRVLDLGRADGGPSTSYASCALRSEGARTVRALFGSDDGCRLYLNGQLVLEDLEPRTLDPLQHTALLALEDGWNRLVLQVENRGGGSAVVCRILERELELARRAP